MIEFMEIAVLITAGTFLFVLASSKLSGSEGDRKSTIIIGAFLILFVVALVIMLLVELSDTTPIREYKVKATICSGTCVR